MNKKPERVARVLSSLVVRTGLARVRNLWRERFGREMEVDHLMGWLCEVKRFENDEAEDLTWNEIAELLVPTMNELEDCDREILNAMQIGMRMKAKEIAKAANKSLSLVKQHLRPCSPLRQLGFVEAIPGKQGYSRKKEL